MNKHKKTLAFLLCCVLLTVPFSLLCSAHETSSASDVIKSETPSLSVLIALADRITYTVELESEDADHISYSVSYSHSNPEVSTIIQSAYSEYESGAIALTEVEERLAGALRILAEAEAKDTVRAFPERQTVKDYTYALIAENVNFYTAKFRLTATHSTYDNYAQIESILPIEESGVCKPTTVWTPVISGNVGGITFCCANIYPNGAFMGASYQVSPSGTITHQFATMLD